MNEPLLHPKTRTLLGSFIKNPTHGLILSGKEGTGKLHVAKWLASELETEPLTVSVLEGKSLISIEQIRELYNATRTGTPLTIIIEDSQLLSQDAQNSFLKLLEEPPQHTNFIMTVNDTTNVLPTIRSRTQHIRIAPIEASALLKIGGELSNYSSSELSSLTQTSQQRVGYFLNLLQDQDVYATHQELVSQAKKFYTASIYERHLMLLESKFEKIYIKRLLDILAIIIQSLLKQNQSNQKALEKLSTQASIIESTAQHVLALNGNPKIHLTKLAQQL